MAPAGDRVAALHRSVFVSCVDGFILLAGFWHSGRKARVPNKRGVLGEFGLFAYNGWCKAFRRMYGIAWRYKLSAAGASGKYQDISLFICIKADNLCVRKQREVQC
jgi:hypothetical protein